MSRLVLLVGFACSACAASGPVDAPGAGVASLEVAPPTLDADQFWARFAGVEVGMSRRAVRELLGAPQREFIIPCRSHYRGLGEGLCFVQDSVGSRPRRSETDFDEWGWGYPGGVGDSLAHVFFVAGGDSVIASGASSSSAIY